MQKYKLKMRTYKFRGKDNNNIWRYGHLLTRDIDTGRVYIREMSVENKPPRYTDYEVDPESVGQWSGKQDRNKVDIYENDIIDHWFFDIKSGDRSIVVFKGGSFCGKAIDRNAWTSELPHKGEVIGNTIDTPELVQNKAVK